jgi:hypothetical protein
MQILTGLLACLPIAGLLLLPAGLGAFRSSAQEVAPPVQPAAAPIDFERDIKPILQRSCFECHSEQRARGRLRLDDRTLAFRGGMSGPVVVPGDSEHSLLIRRVLGLDEEDRMPLDEDPLPDEEIALLRAWIDQGAVWPGAEQAEAATLPQHWAYMKPVASHPPAVKNEAWPRTPIDRFILARLEEEGVTPSPEADRETLIRRASLDLIGLPPGLDEVEEFLADDRPDAYDRLVDRLLASPHYGERWARPWLDLARYADSHGYEKDRLRVMWKYRDWVVDALNADMPFDRFTIEQIAGDMLPNATTEQRIASGFHRNTMLNQEGGIDVEEARWETIVDRVNTTATVWLGSTIACAQCHNHKYDPFSQKDYYRLFAFFDNVEYTVGGPDGGDRFIAEPELDLPTPAQEARRQELRAEIEKLTAELKASTPELEAGRIAWERQLLDEPGRWVTLQPIDVRSTGGSTLRALDDGSVLASGETPGDDTYIVTTETTLAAITGIRLEVLPHPSLPQGGPGRDPYGNFLLTGLDIEAAPRDGSAPGSSITVQSARDDDALSRFDINTVFQPAGYGNLDLPSGWSIDATREETRLPRQAVIVPEAPVAHAQGTRFRVTLTHRGGAVGQGLGRFRLSVTDADDPLKVVGVRARVRAILEVPAEKRTDVQNEAVAAQYRSVAPALEGARTRLADLQAELRKLGIVTALVMKERPSHERPSTHLRVRGSFLEQGEKVYAEVPEVLHPLPADAMPNRLGLARWLVDEENPLVGRVVVNRAWEQFFGRGLVETSEDFGLQGELPSHPDLLDWLAVRFVEQGWSQKKLHRLIVTSATYRQASRASPALVARDPYNRLLARGPRFRVEAEMVRDIALAAGGLLSRKVGGPSVFPPQPDGIWRNPYSDEKWIASEGEDRYRRGLYTFLRRTSPYPSFLTFDATSREYCTVRRVRTNTPLQALTLLNDPVFFEAAQHLAKRTLAEAAADPRARAAHAFRLALTRRPRPEEVDRLLASYDQQLAFFRAHPDDAARVIGSGERPGGYGSGVTNDSNGGHAHGAGAWAPGEGEGPDVAERAAWTMIANSLLNLDETVTKQ